MTRTAAEFYDLLAGEYDRRWAYGPRTTGRQAAWLSRHCPQGRLLDLGCGTGRMLAPLAKAGFDPLGLDCSWGMLARARARHPETPLVLADAGGSLPFASKSMSTVIALHATLSHITDADQQQRLADEVLRLLGPGGTWVIELPHPTTFPPLDRHRGWRTYRPGISCRSFGSGLEELCIDHQPGLRTMVHVLDPQRLQSLLKGFARVTLHAGFSERPFSPHGGRSMVMRACK